jgi:SAM-dependent methyltransferase
MSDSVACPVCQSTQTEDMGPPIHRRPTVVAGIPIDLADLPLRHRHCSVCGYWFVWPRIPFERLLACYSQSVNEWGTGTEVAQRRNYDHKKALLEQYAPAKSALDFGCYDGGFLDLLGPEWRKAGIEPSASAAAKAKERGVEIIGSSLETTDLSPYAGQFGAVVIFDVMEHIPDPVGDLRRLREVLMPGGVMLIETGDTGSPDYGRFGKYHPYCGIAEHIGFFNRKSIDFAARRADLTLEHFEPSLHFNYYPGDRYFSWYIRGYQMLRFLRKLHLPMSQRFRDIAEGPVPRGTGVMDHFLAVLRREPDSEPLSKAAAQTARA